MIVSHLLLILHKKIVLYLYVWSLKCGKRSQSSRGPNTFARHCIFYSNPLTWWQLCTLVILSTSFMRNDFPNVLKEFPHMLSTCWLLFLHSAVQLIPNHLNWVEVGWLWRTVHLMQHSITLLPGQIALTQPGGVLGHCPGEKQRIVPLSANQRRWRSAAECSGSHAGYVCLEF